MRHLPSSVAAADPSATPPSQYLQRYAEPEALDIANRAVRLPRYEHVLTVPVHAESSAALPGLTEPIQQERVLLLLVVNDPADASTTARNATQTFLTSLRDQYPAQLRLAPGITFSERNNLGLLCIERTSKTHPIHPKKGVGLARKIAADVAVSLKGAGRITGHFIHCSDADAQLPPDYFRQSVLATNDSVALIYRFMHVATPDTPHWATLSYEIYLRQHVLRLARAGSPYAFHSLGSLLAVDIDAYQRVRGFPKRPAAEDFYLLNKLAKLGVVERLAGTPVRLLGRASDRVPMGTGPAIQRVLSGQMPIAIEDACYEKLRVHLNELQSACVQDELKPEDARRWTPDMARSIARALKASQHPAHRLRHVHTWFDGLRTRQFLRRAQLELTSGSPDIPAVSRCSNITELEILQQTLMAAECREATGPCGVPVLAMHTS